MFVPKKSSRNRFKIRKFGSKKSKLKALLAKGRSIFPSGLSSQSVAKSLPKDAKTLNLLVSLTTMATAFLIVSILLTIVVFAYFSRSLPSPNRLLERSFELSTRFYDKNGELIFEVFGEKNRTLVTLDQIPPVVVNSTLATEDSEFHLHRGFSLRGMLRAVRNTFTGEGLQGGSTITQQVIKNTLLTQDRTVTRKIKELILSLQLENRYSKEEIIQMYLNETPYGGQNYGIFSASKAYFNKTPDQLTLSEAAYLSGLPQRPSYYSQFGSNPEAGIERRNYVLYLMKERGWIGSDGRRYFINDDEYKSATEEELKFETAKVPLAAPHFVFYTKKILADMFGEQMVEQGGLRVTTTLDLKTQELAQETVTKEVADANSLNVWNGSMVVLDPKTGHILAMVGSKGYNLDPEPDGCTSGLPGKEGCKFDPYVNVTTSLRQPGSAIKPVTYATMLSQGYSASFPFLDVPSLFEGSAPDKPYEPENYDGIFRGVMSLRRSLGNSLNIPAVKALKIVGIDNMIDQAEKMGITTFTDRQRYGLALTLGGGEVRLLELTSAFSVFAAQGKYRQPTPILEVKDSNDNVLYKWQDTGGVEALSDEVAFLISDILADNGARSSAFGTGSLLVIPGKTVSVKTGTTDDKRDNYAIGFTPSVVAGSWVGNNNNEEMNPYISSGITGATPIWHNFMVEYLKDSPDEKPEVPKNVKKIEIDELTGMLPYGDNNRRQEWFIENTEPTAPSDWFQRIKVCEQDSRIANESCDKYGDTDEKTFIRIQAELPEWQTSVDAWVKENYEDDKYFPPLMRSKLEYDSDGEVENKDEVNVAIVGVDDGDTLPLNFRLNIEVSSYHDVSLITIYMDGEKIAEDSSEPYGYNFKLGVDKIGEHEFEATARNKNDDKGSTKVKLNVSGYARN